MDEVVYSISGGLVVLLIIAARFILPLLQESYNLYHRISGVRDMSRSGFNVTEIEIAIGNPTKRKDA